MKYSLLQDSVFDIIMDEKQNISSGYNLRSMKDPTDSQKKILYKIPNGIIQEFGRLALENRSINGHIETLALITGVQSGNDIIAKELIFPRQKGSPIAVEDLGKYSCNIHTANSYSENTVEVQQKDCSLFWIAVIYCR